MPPTGSGAFVSPYKARIARLLEWLYSEEGTGTCLQFTKGMTIRQVAADLAALIR